MSLGPPISLWPDPEALGPATDLYQLTMMAGYLAAGRGHERATFELFVRRLPKPRAYLIFAGLEQAIGDLLNLRFSRAQIDGLRQWPVFGGIDTTFFDWLEDFRFRGDVWAVPEGTAVFGGEPLVRVEGSVPEAQLVETLLLASLGYPTLVASKAARVVQAAAGRRVYDFGARRGHGPHAGFLAARASYLAGCAGTSHVEAARRLGIPCVGTMAHSWVQSFQSESEAFTTFARFFPNGATLLIDTYDTVEGARRAAAVEPPVAAVRIDSGDHAALALNVRRELDGRGRGSVRIVASGDLDEHSIAEIVGRGAPIDAFGVGTEMITSRDAPALSMVYKLVEVNGAGRIKLSPGKVTYPMAKQVFRRRDAAGRFQGDLVGLAEERAEGEPLLVPYLRGGTLATELPPLEAIRERCAAQVAAIPETLRRLDATSTYRVEYTDALKAEAERLGSHH